MSEKKMINYRENLNKVVVIYGRQLQFCTFH